MPAHTTTNNNNSSSSGGGATEEENLWETILKESVGQKNTISEHNVVIVGNSSCGKRTLLHNLGVTKNITADSLNGKALNYTYADVSNKEDQENDEVSSRVNFWLLHGDSYSDLLKLAINTTTISNSAIVLCVDLSKPWEVEESLKMWGGLIQKHVEEVYRSMPQSDVHALKDSIRRHFLLYTEPTEEAPVGAAARKEAEELRLQIDLPEEVLQVNLGIPLIVCVLKADSLERLESEHKYKADHFDFLQQHIRSFCLNYAASLFYTCPQQPDTYVWLWEYINHRLCGSEFKRSASVRDPQTVMVPSGWDTLAKIKETVANEKIANETFGTIFPRPSRRSESSFEPVAKADDDQEFLKALKAELEKAGARATDSPARVPIPPSSTRSVDSDKDKTKPATRPARPGTKEGDSPTAPTTSGDPKTNASGEPSDDALVNFFHSLLNRNASMPPQQRGASSTKLQKDAEKELNRIKGEGQQ